MIILILIQVISIDGAYESYHRGDYEQAYHISQQIQDSSGFYQDELIELRAMLSMHTGRYKEADMLFQKAIKTEYDSIRRKAYTNYAELHNKLFNFEKRIYYLEKAFKIQPTQKLIRIIARHHFQINADYETAQTWINRHPDPQTDKDQAGFDLLQAEFAESKSQYSQAIRYYQQAKISAKKAGLFNYELFSAQGVHRASQLREHSKKEKMKDLIVMIILAIAYYGGRRIYIRYNERNHADI